MLLFKVTNEYHLYDGDKAIATTIVGNPMLLPILSRKNCDEVFGVINVEKLAFNYADEIGILHTTLAYSKHFKAGFNKAIELNKDKLFTLGDLRRAFSRGKDLTTEEKFKVSEWDIFTKFVDSLQQPTEVEIEMEYYDPFPPTRKVDLRPKLDEDGCLILKIK